MGASRGPRVFRRSSGGKVTQAVYPVASELLPELALPKIAVIVPNRNDSRYLPRCIRSVLEQPGPPDELIIVDDQSTDDSVSVVRALIAGQSRARLIENPVNLGTY